MDWKRLFSVGKGVPFAAAAVALSACALAPFRSVLPPPAVMLLFVPVIVGVARVSGTRASAAASFIAFALLDFLFISPYYHLSVASPLEWIGLLIFLFVALVIGQQTGRLKERERAAIDRQRELELFNRLSFMIASEGTAAASAGLIVSQVSHIVGAPRVALYVPAQPPLSGIIRLAEVGEMSATGREIEFVEWVLHEGKAIGLAAGGADPDERLVSVDAREPILGATATAIYVPLLTSKGIEGVLVAIPGVHEAGIDESQVLVVVANLSATFLERERLRDQAAHAAALREATTLKSTLVSSVSHELKTPLAAATARITGLLEEGKGCDATRVTEELAAVAEDLGRLNDSIGDLLDLSRLESDSWRPTFEVHEVSDVLGTVLARLPVDGRSRVRFDLPEPELPVRVDFAQLVRALVNVIENALAYAPAGTEVEVGVRAEHGEVVLRVEDRGPGVTDADKPRIFEKFYRGTAAECAPGGTGLGLAIANEIIRAHGGRMSVEDALPTGARFVMVLPLADDEGGATS